MTINFLKNNKLSIFKLFFGLIFCILIFSTICLGSEKINISHNVILVNNAVAAEPTIDELNAQMAADNAKIAQEASAAREAAKKAAEDEYNSSDAIAAREYADEMAMQEAEKKQEEEKNKAEKAANLKQPEIEKAATTNTVKPANTVNATKDDGKESSWVLAALSWIVYWLAVAIGKIFIFFLQFLIQVAQWNSFVNTKTVEVGWGIVRDFCNMFFIFILLIIAFGTILQRDDYNAKKLLPKLLIMAILINFSKTICGLIIDFSQVIMLTFISAIGNGGNNLADLLGIDKMYQSGKNTNGSSLGVFTGLVVAFLTTIVSCIVVWAFIFMLISRVIMLWVYIVLSPLAYLLAAFPQGQKYSSQWWGDFTKNVIVGPILAFFLWLALATAQESSKTLVANISNKTSGVGAGTGSFLSNFLSDDSFSKAIITMGILLAGLKVAQSIGASAGGALGKASARITKGQAALTGFASRKAQDMTGISAVRQYASNWSAARKSARDDRITAQTVALSKGLGMAKQKTIGAVGKWASGKLNRNGEEAAKLRKEAYQGNNILNSLDSRNDIDYEGLKLTKDDKGVWRNEHDTVISDDELTTRLKEKINTKEKLAKERLSAQNKIDGTLKWGAVGLGLAAGLGTGGLAGAAMGGFAGKGLMGSLGEAKNAGDMDKKYISKYNNEQISKKRTDYKEMDDGEVMTVVHDSNKNGHERAAAMSEMVSRGHAFGPESKDLINEIDKKLEGGGRSKQNGEFTDSKFSSNYKSLQKKYDAGSHPDMQKAFAGDSEAVYNAQQSFNDGSTKMSSFSAADLATAIQKGLLDGMKLSAFGKAFTELGPQTQKLLKETLKKNNTYESKAMLAKVDNIGEAGFTDEERVKYLQGMSRKDFQDIINEGDNNSKKALREAVRTLDDLPEDIRESVSSVAKEIRRHCGVSKAGDNS